MDVMREIRKKAQTEEIDYLFLMNALASLKHPRNKLTALLKSKDLIRVKKGLYVLGKEHAVRPYSLEILANLIYGPSYISFEYALGYWGMIPERVTRITSACYKRNKHFRTPVGEFIYHYLDPKKFPAGITWESIDENSHFLIATKEKALTDLLAKQKTFDSQEELKIYLIEGMRIPTDMLYSLRATLVKEIASTYKNRNVDLLWQLLKE